MKIAIVGSRKFPDMKEVRRFVRHLAEMDKLTIIVSGAGDDKRRRTPREKWGVDEHAEDEAIAQGLVVVSYPAEWKRRPDGTVDRGAGFKRNGLIVEQAHQVVAFWDGESRGTKDTIDKARKMRRPIEIVIYVPGVGAVVGV